MSPKLGTSGHRCARTALGNSSTSQKATASQPSGSHATVAASMPEKMLMYLIGSLRLMFSHHRRHANESHSVTLTLSVQATQSSSALQ